MESMNKEEELKLRLYIEYRRELLEAKRHNDSQYTTLVTAISSALIAYSSNIFKNSIAYMHIWILLSFIFALSLLFLSILFAILSIFAGNKDIEIAIKNAEKYIFEEQKYEPSINWKE